MNICTLFLFLAWNKLFGLQGLLCSLFFTTSQKFLLSFLMAFSSLPWPVTSKQTRTLSHWMLYTTYHCVDDCITAFMSSTKQTAHKYTAIAGSSLNASFVCFIVYPTSLGEGRPSLINSRVKVKKLLFSTKSDVSLAKLIFKVPDHWKFLPSFFPLYTGSLESYSFYSFPIQL